MQDRETRKKIRRVRAPIPLLICVALMGAGFAVGYLLDRAARGRSAIAEAENAEGAARLKAALVWNPEDVNTYIGPNMVIKDGRMTLKEGVVTAEPYDTTLAELARRGCFTPAFSYLPEGYLEVSARVFTREYGQRLVVFFDGAQEKGQKIRRVSVAFSQYGIASMADDYSYHQRGGREYLIAPKIKPGISSMDTMILFYLGGEYAYPYAYIGIGLEDFRSGELFKIAEGMTIENPGGGLPTAPAG